MEKKELILLLLCLLVAPTVSAAASGDATAMSALAKSLTNLPPTWTSGTDPCKWDGVKCTSGRVTSIDLNGMSVSGALPDAVTQLSSLQRLDLGRNSISGPIPSLSGLSTLLELDLDANAFSSIPPDFFSSLTSLQSVSLDENPLAPWTIPLDVAGCTGLSSFSASNASVAGGVPDFFDKLPTLTTLKLSYNNLTGGLPTSFAGSGIQQLYLNNQQGPRLSGRIDVIGSMPQLKLVYLQSNGFTGPIPDLSNLTSLQNFNLRDNHLTGPVPPSLTSSPTISNVALSNNMLQGPLPKFAIGATVDIASGNQFCSPKPEPCDNRVTVLLSVAGGFGYPTELANSWQGNDPCSSGWTGVTCDVAGKDVVVLNFANKHYGGTISPDIANLTALTKIILSDNDLMGPIPDRLATLPQLKLLDVTNNSLTGKVPAFPSSVVLKASGNPKLGSDSGSSSVGGEGSGSATGGTPGSSSVGNPSGGSKSSSGAVIGGIAAAVSVLIGCSVCFVYYQRRKKHAQKFGRVETQSPPNEQDMVKIGMAGMNSHSGATSELYSQSSVPSVNAHLVEAQSMLISIQALRKATNNFSEDRILGRGGFGVVYKGELNGTLIAVKRNECDLTSKKGMEEFRAEIDVLRKVRHRHLVALLGYCMDGSERLLVYEYMPEGTLGQHLFDRNKSSYSAIGWKQRLVIALDVARGIEYLHSLAQESFIHRDLKPSNILLDKDMRAKVSDFGLVKLADNEKSMMTRLAGTFGYLAPEYAITGKVSTKVDVYAFGVILMELITGRKALDESLPDEETHLVSCFRRNILNKDKFMKSVDPTLDLDEEASSSMLEVAELARHCTAREPNQRPDMSHAVNVLAPFVEKWKPSRCDDEDNFDDSSVSLSQRLEKWQFDDGTSTMDLFSSHMGSQSTKYD